MTGETPRRSPRGVRRRRTHLSELQPAGRAARRRAGPEVVLQGDPGLQGLQLAGGQVGGVMLDQVALELVRLEVEVDGHRVAHGEIPGDPQSNTREGGG